jgi:predicted  nucleic acid-binding Zn-ribbon protein
VTGPVRRLAGAARQNPVWARVQRKIDTVVAVRTDPALHDVRERVERVERGQADVRAELRAELQAGLDAVRRTVDERCDALAGDLRRLEDELRRLSDGVAELREQHGRVTFDVDRLGPHVAALEVRIADRERAEGPVEVSSPEDVPEARRLLDDVLREHERIRVRFSGIALYEERLRKLEAARWSGPADGSTGSDGADGAGTA